MDEQPPILESDWQIDTQEVVDLFLDDGVLRSKLKLSENDCSTLSLTRCHMKELLPVVWILRVGRCQGGYNGGPYFLDAITGERLE